MHAHWSIRHLGITVYDGNSAVQVYVMSDFEHSLKIYIIYLDRIVNSFYLYFSSIYTTYIILDMGPSRMAY